MTDAEKWIWDLRQGVIEAPDADSIQFDDGTRVEWDGQSWEVGATFKKTELGRKDDTTKPRWSLLPYGTIVQVIGVLEFGAKRYQVDNWMHVEGSRRRYYDAAQRHLESWWTGQRIDPDSGLPHLAHAVCSLLFLMWFDAEKPDA